MLEYRLNRIIMVSIVLSIFVFPVFADAGVPMIALAWPGMVILLIPVIAIELLVYRKMLKTQLKQSIIFTAISNAVSTIVGIPLTWVILVLIQMVSGGGGGVGNFNTFLGKILAVTWQAAWLLPYDSQMYWMIPTAMFVLLIPFFFASWLIEYWICWLMLKKSNIDYKIIRKAVFKANLYSYALLAGIIIIYLVVSIIMRVKI